ncbi:DUF5994 family protein [Actinocrispum wychmicini]|uniref:Uncharacterized protein n=1 Tax=Actinocrispum wychmicini TaxID=1213861 RepID=A0A4R2JKF5_9PSEU|nr:DUF5994 family protein [Actinocrispum wychmicini]TCO60481.1 hypothetical protein EV192_10356 [Actinocrispum wychmicini]
MTLDWLGAGSAPYRPPPDPRLRIKPTTGVRGQVDGAWWPRSADPAAEFPGLVMALSSWIGPVNRLACHFGAWHPVVPEIVTNGWAVSLEDCPTLPPDTVMAISADDRRMTVLVVPVGTRGGVARAVMYAAAARDTVATAAEILTSNGVPGSIAANGPE